MNHSRTPIRDSQDKDLTAKEENGIIYVWGNNHQGQLGLGDNFVGKTYSSPRPLTFSFFIQEVACGEDHAVFVTSRGQIYTMGSNAEGRLGLGNRSIHYTANPTLVEASQSHRCVQVACGWSHTLAVMESGDVFSWGAGESGALGTGTIENVWSPRRIALEEGIFLGTKKVSAGATHSAFISEIGTIYVCGAGDAGQLGTGKRDRELKPIQVTLITEKVKDVACGVFHTLILTERNKVYSTGGNIFGQLGLGNKKSTNIPIRVKELDYLHVSKVACGHHSAALTESGEIYIWGAGAFGEFLSPTKFSRTGQVFKEIQLNGFYGTAIDNEGRVWAWGSNNSGELGQGHYESKTKLCLNETLWNKKIDKLACGTTFVIALGEVPGRSRKTSPLRHRRQGSEHMQAGDSNARTPQKVDQLGYDVTEGRLASTTEVKEKGGTRLTWRTSSVGKQREGFDNSIRRGSNVRARAAEVTEFVDLLGREKRGGEGERMREARDIAREERDDLGVMMGKLMNQKEDVEKALRREKTEKRMLEKELNELNQRLQQVQEGPEGLYGLNENFNRQSERLDEMKTYYEEEAWRREKILQELHQEQLASRELAKKLIEKEEIIATLHIRSEQGEAFHKRVNELELSKQRLAEQVEELEQDRQGHLTQIDRQAARIAELERMLSQKSDSIQRLEDHRQTDVDKKRMLENEVLSLNSRVRELESRLERISKENERDIDGRRQLEEELRASRQREETTKEHMRKMMGELDDIKGAFERSIEHEQHNKSRLLQNNTTLEQQLQALRDDNVALSEEKAHIEDELLQTQQKNRRLLELLNQEIDKQNQTLDKSISSPMKQQPTYTMDDLHRDIEQVRAPERVERVERRRSSGRNREEPPSKDERADIPIKPELRTKVDLPYRSVEKSQYLNPERVPAERPLKGSTNALETPIGDKQGYKYQFESFGSPNVDLGHERLGVARARINESPQRRQAAVSRNTHDSNDYYGQSGQSAGYSPQRSETVREMSSYSGEKRRSMSPSRGYSTNEYQSRDTDINETKPYMDDLKEVHEKMEALERNKRELQSRMQDFEARLKVDPK